MEETTKRYANGSKYQVICRVSEIEARLKLAKHHRYWIIAGVVYAITLASFVVWAIFHW